jgi:hypothetical protein
MRPELSALTKSGKTLGVRSFYSGDLDAMFEYVAGVIAVFLRNSHRSLARHWQNHLPEATADNTSLLAKSPRHSG